MVAGSVAIIIIVLITVLFVHFRSANKRTVTLFHQLSCLGSQHHLSFTSHQRLSNCIIGLDGLNQRFLLMTHDVNGLAGHTQVVSLADVKACVVKQKYRSLDSSFNSQQLLEKVVLSFEMKKTLPVEIVFYHHLHNPIEEAPYLKERAKDWEIILSKMCSEKKEER